MLKALFFTSSLAILAVATFWSGVYVREGGQMKIRMLTVGMKPPPKEASADKK
jgi:hypothetical protein